MTDTAVPATTAASVAATAASATTPSTADLAVYRGLFQSMTGYDDTMADADGAVPLQTIKTLQKRVEAVRQKSRRPP